MAIGLYLDAHVPKAITMGLRLRGVDVVTAQEDNAADLSDAALLDRCVVLRRVFFTFDRHLLAEAARRQQKGIYFAGLIYSQPQRVAIGTCVRSLEVFAKASKLEELANRVEFLPL